MISDTDPLNQGRVKVQFDWQSGQDTSEFIRVMNPDAGSSDKVNKNRGFMAIPEVGDQVIINFVHQHPDRPFVMGGMFHGGVGGGGGAGNNVKSLSSKSGNIICLNDGAGIEIKDRNGNHVTLSGTGDITTFVSNDNNEDIGNNHTTNVKTKTTINVGKDQSVLTMDNGGKISVKSNTEIKLETGSSSITMKEDGTIDIKGINITIAGSVIKINGSGSVTADNSSDTSCSASGINISPSIISINNPSQVDIN
ncbi:phage baseplate assembly protein V [Chryseobacterium sp. 5_R23647]|uniref:phage baseplate assembly protein V n=1 Tax=Chryseobacterium sp. 5_R23647 TaxID=2258964 RepID=UPI001E515F6B|nr:phage baseplate assembly protein V [Chryseobacterium sp. 5_R23647]